MRAAKTLALAALTAATLSGQAIAGGFSPEAIEPPVAPVVFVEPEAAGSSWGWVVPVVALAALAALALSEQ
jgi:hypothetical protein